MRRLRLYVDSKASLKSPFLSVSDISLIARKNSQMNLDNK